MISVKTPSVLFVTRQELLSFFSIVWVLLVGSIYIFVTIFLLNYRFVSATLTNASPVSEKLTVFFSLLGGLFTAFSLQDSLITLLSAVFVGINVVLIAKTVYALEHNGKIKLSIGGATLLGLISTGCSSCGFSLLSIVGLSTSLSFLPFHGMELHVLSLGLLIFSAYYMLKKLRDSLYCVRS